MLLKEKALPLRVRVSGEAEKPWSNVAGDWPMPMKNRKLARLSFVTMSLYTSGEGLRIYFSAPLVLTKEFR